MLIVIVMVNEQLRLSIFIFNMIFRPYILNLMRIYTRAILVIKS